MDITHILQALSFTDYLMLIIIGVVGLIGFVLLIGTGIYLIKGYDEEDV